MARRTTTRRISRREAVELLGATAVIGAARPAPASAGQAERDKKHPECEQPAPVHTYTGRIGPAMVSYSCCPETRTAILVGVEEPNHRPTTRGKGHLKPIRDRLLADQLQEWCLMVWGLDKSQVDALVKSVPRQLELTVRSPDAPKK